MDLTLFFSPVDEGLYSGITATSSFIKNIRVFGEKMPDIRGAHIALFGINETRGAGHHPGHISGPDEVRKKLYQLKRGSGGYRIVDLGNLNAGIDLDESYVRLSEVCRILMEQNVLPLIIGGSQDLDYGQYWAYERLEKMVSILNVDAFLDLDDKHTSKADRKHIHKILLHEPNFLHSYIHLAYQSYLIDPASIAILEKLYFEAFRVGQMRHNFTEIEPTIRQADMLSFDLSSIKSADAPGSEHAQPFGLTGEEACQICWYAGLNEKLSSAGFYGYSPDFDDEHRKTASVVATMIWYFIEGFYERKHELNFRSNDFIKYVVAMPQEPETLTFYKSKLTEKWWMEIVPPHVSQYARNSMVPCSYNDYLQATKGELPERFLTAIAKL